DMAALGASAELPAVLAAADTDGPRKSPTSALFRAADDLLAAAFGDPLHQWGAVGGPVALHPPGQRAGPGYAASGIPGAAEIGLAPLLVGAPGRADGRGAMPPAGAGATTARQPDLALIAAAVIAEGDEPSAGGRSPHVATFTFTDRPDLHAGENYGLLPETFGYASGLLVTFDVSRGRLRQPEVVGMPPGWEDASAEVIAADRVFVEFANACVMPTSPEAPAGVGNRVTFQVKTHPHADVTPTQVMWTAAVNNVIPRGLGFETNQDSEPGLAVNPGSGPGHRAAVIRTYSRIHGETILSLPRDNSWQADGVAPFWVSTSTGRTWEVRGILPQPAPGALGPGDPTLAYNSDGSLVYGAFLSGNTRSVFIRSSPDPHTTDFEGGSTLLSGPNFGLDQPSIQAAQTGGQERVYLATNDNALVVQPRTATVFVSTDGGTSFQAPVRLDRGPVVQQDSAPVPVAV